MTYEVDLEKIANEYVDINKYQLQNHGKPQVVLDALKIKVYGNPRWSLQPVGNMKTQTVHYDACQNGLYSELTVNNSSVLGNSFTIKQGLVKGYNKKLTVPVTKDWRTALGGQKHVDLYPGQTVTDNKQKVNLSLGTSHLMTPVTVRSSKSVANIDVTERHYRGKVTFDVLLKGNVLFLRGSGSTVSEIDIRQVVRDVQNSRSNSANNVLVENRNGSENVYWKMEVDADILCDFEENLNLS